MTANTLLFLLFSSPFLSPPFCGRLSDTQVQSSSSHPVGLSRTGLRQGPWDWSLLQMEMALSKFEAAVPQTAQRQEPKLSLPGEITDLIILKNTIDLFLLSVLTSTDMHILNKVGCDKEVLIVLNSFLIMEVDYKAIRKFRVKHDEETESLGSLSNCCRPS